MVTGALEALIGFFVLELSRAILTEGMYQSTNRIPVLHPQLTIFIVELVRFLIAIICVIRNRGKVSFTNLEYMAVQAVMWFVNNVLYFATLKHASVATISILLQLRLPITGILHHFLVRKQENWRVWAALGVIYVGVVCAQWTGHFSLTDMWTIYMTLLLSLISSVASIVSEKMMKSLTLPFWEQQVRVTLLGIVSSTIFLAFSNGAFVNHDSISVTSVLFTIGSILAAAGTGLFTGMVVRRLDSVVKLIAQAVAAICTTWVVYIVFGSFKAVYGFFLLGSFLLIVGTLVYGLETTVNPAYTKYRKLYRWDSGKKEELKQE
ncbi:hypothetical protein HDU79_006689 [Rhizoclosmatium sp. JEL0117]|nr:hypothetical protein HDU99_005395 [Rhizoclosmatium hyalinum]KAJ3286178.1 hypothetical protein HDU79_006689 [Rhizoclosmatium sp. JEL0117]